MPATIFDGLSKVRLPARVTEKWLLAARLTLIFVPSDRAVIEPLCVAENVFAEVNAGKDKELPKYVSTLKLAN